MKKVKISSTKTILVTSGLQFEDYTIQDSDIPNRMKVAPKWTKQLIYEGIHTYPAEIAEWPTVKALAAQAILMIQGYEGEDPVEEPVEEQPRRRRRKAEDTSLDEIAGE